MPSFSVAWLGVLFGASVQTASAVTPQVIDELAAPYVESEVVVGMTVGVIQGERVVVRGYGQLSEEDSRTPDGRTVYEIGSVSKVFTGVLLADAVIQGRVSLVTPVEDLLPPRVKMNRRHESLPIRLWHLATHTSGLPYIPGNLKPADPSDPFADYTGKQLAAFLADFQPRKRPGEEIVYSNLAVGLLGDLLARERKADYQSLLRQRITAPLGMNDTRIELDESQQERLAPPHAAGGAPNSNWTFSRLAGCGAIRSTVDDLILFTQAHLDRREDDLGRALDLAWMVHQRPIQEGEFAMGLGWHVAHDGSTRWHNGETGGYRAAVFVNRGLGVAAIVLTNTASEEVDLLAGQLLRVAAGATEKPREFEKAFEVDREVLRRYAGEYQFAPGLVLTVAAKQERLMARLSGQPAYQVFPRSETEWFYRVVDATLTFQVNRGGECTAVELFQNGVRQVAERVK